jgi:NAD-dependent DNA ligase
LEKIDDPDQLDDIKTQILSIKGFKKRADVFVEQLIEFNQWLAEHNEITLCDPDQEDSEEEGKSDDDKNEENENKADLSGQTMVFTGCRADAPLQRNIERKGGRVVSAVSKKTTILVVKDLEGKETVKMRDARANGAKVMAFSDFLTTYGLTI